MARKEVEKIKGAHGTHEVEFSLHIGDRRVCFAVNDDNPEIPYLVCDSHRNPIIGGHYYNNAEGSADYLEVMGEFIDRVQNQVEKTRQELAQRGPAQPRLTQEHCLPHRGVDLEGKVIIIYPSTLRREYQTADQQIQLATGGFGCKPGAGGRAVYCTNLYDGSQCRFEIIDVMGLADPDKLPAWAKEKIAELGIQQPQPEKQEKPEQQAKPQKTATGPRKKKDGKERERG